MQSPNRHTDPPKFDLDTYIGNYQGIYHVFSAPATSADKIPGRTKFERLYLIGLSSTYIGVDALKLAVREAKAGRDIRRYLEALQGLQALGPHEPEASRDQSWVDKVEKQNQADLHRLEGELKGYKNNLIKESIRVR